MASISVGDLMLLVGQAANPADEAPGPVRPDPVPAGPTPPHPAQSLDAGAQTVGVSRQWSARLSELGAAVGMTALQEAEFHRLAQDQQLRIRREIPRLVEALKPHFDTPGEAEAKRCYEAGLRALKAQLDQEADDLLCRFGQALG